MGHTKILLAAAAGLGMIPAAADAAVRYDFEAFSSFPFDGESILSGGFSVTLPDFVSAAAIPAASLDSCSVVTNFQVGTCSDQSFDSSGAFDRVAFGIVTGANPNTQVYYYFADGAFEAVGVYDTVEFGASQAGRLTVRVVNNAVPEPATWAMLIIGFGLVGSAARARARNGVRVHFAR